MSSPETPTQNDQEPQENLGQTIQKAAFNRGAVESEFSTQLPYYHRVVYGPHDRIGHQYPIGSKDVEYGRTDVTKKVGNVQTTTQARVNYEERFKPDGPFVTYVENENEQGLKLITNTDAGKKIMTDVELAPGRYKQHKDNPAIETRRVDGQVKYRREMTPRRKAAAQRLLKMTYGLDKPRESKESDKAA